MDPLQLFPVKPRGERGVILSNENKKDGLSPSQKKKAKPGRPLKLLSLVEASKLHVLSQDYRGRVVRISCPKLKEMLEAGQVVFLSLCDTHACLENQNTDCPHEKESTRQTRRKSHEKKGSVKAPQQLIAIECRSATAT